MLRNAHLWNRPTHLVSKFDRDLLCRSQVIMHINEKRRRKKGKTDAVKNNTFCKTWFLGSCKINIVRNLNFARNLKFATCKILINCMNKIMFRLIIWNFSVPKALIYCTFIKCQLNLFILLVFPHVANFRYVANFRFLTGRSLLYTDELE